MLDKKNDPYIIKNGDKYHKIVDVDKFAELDTDSIKNIFKTHYLEIMFHELIDFLIKEEKISQEEVLEEKLNSEVPIDGLLKTLEFLESVLKSKINKEDFLEFRETIEDEYISLFKKTFRFEIDETDFKNNKKSIDKID